MTVGLSLDTGLPGPPGANHDGRAGGPVCRLPLGAGAGAYAAVLCNPMITCQCIATA